MTPAEEIHGLFARAINWDAVDQLTDEQLDQLTQEPPLCGCGARHWSHTDDDEETPS